MSDNTNNNENAGNTSNRAPKAKKPVRRGNTKPYRAGRKKEGAKPAQEVKPAAKKALTPVKKTRADAPRKKPNTLLASMQTQVNTRNIADSKRKKLRIIPLGGLQEIGKNITAFEYGDDIIIVDCGVMFPKDDQPGIDLVVPDMSYLVKNKDKIRALLLTHGHEDHIGSVPFLLRQMTVPVYGTELTLALVGLKLKEHRLGTQMLHTVRAGESMTFGSFKVEFIHVNHSIADALAIAIHTPVGTILHTGDFKIDYTPVDGAVTDLVKFADLGRRGVLLLMGESTNAERPGYTMSERKVGESLNTYFNAASGRIIVAMFASNVHRMQQVADLAMRYGRKLAFVGRSLLNVSKAAMSIGDLKIPEGRLIDIDRVDDYEDEDIVILTTGSQGETMAGLTRMSVGEHQKVKLRPSDTIIISATPIPGNEKLVSRVVDNLMRTGASVVYQSLAEVHVSGHACQEELKLVLALTKPRFFMPIHGEYRHQYKHAVLAESMGTPAGNICLAENGNIIELSQKTIRIVGNAPTGSVLVDGSGIGDVGNIVLRDRKHLSQDGLMIVVIAVDKETGALVSGPEIISRGFVYVRENEALMGEVRSLVLRLIKETDNMHDWGAIKNNIREELHRMLYAKTKRNPMILPIIVDA